MIANKRSLTLIPVLLLQLLLSTTAYAQYLDSTEVLDKAPEGTFTIAVIPDTQRYHGRGSIHDKTKAPTSNPSFQSRVDWLADHLKEQRIAFVSHMGDIVDLNNDHQWRLAKVLMDRLHRKIPYGISPGNHDISRVGDTSKFQKYFGAERFKDFPWYGGFYPGRTFVGKAISGNNANSYQLFSAGDLDFIILHLECNAPDDVLDWTTKILSQYRNRMAVITTHMFLGPIKPDSAKDKETTREGIGIMRWKKVHGFRGNTPQQMWEKCFRQHPNVFLVLSGDQSTIISARHESLGDSLNVVHSVMQDYPRTVDKDDWIRLFRFYPEEEKIKVITYSPVQDRLCTGLGYLRNVEDHQFELDISDAIRRYRTVREAATSVNSETRIPNSVP